ncbi:MAG: hypothetical protein AB1489_42965 [Acidobacteriota bacterium]
MICLSVLPYSGWRKDFARFGSDLSNYKLNVKDCYVEADWIAITVIVSSTDERQLVVELAHKRFGKSYKGFALSEYQIPTPQ